MPEEPGAALPQHTFAVLVGIIYFIFAWAWSSSDPRQSPIMLKLAEDVASQADAARATYVGIQGEISDLEARIDFKAQQVAGAPPTPSSACSWTS